MRCKKACMLRPNAFVLCLHVNDRQFHSGDIIGTHSSATWMTRTTFLCVGRPRLSAGLHWILKQTVLMLYTALKIPLMEMNKQTTGSVNCIRRETDMIRKYQYWNISVIWYDATMELNTLCLQADSKMPPRSRHLLMDWKCFVITADSPDRLSVVICCEIGTNAFIV